MFIKMQLNTEHQRTQKQSYYIKEMLQCVKIDEKTASLSNLKPYRLSLFFVWSSHHRCCNIYPDRRANCRASSDRRCMHYQGY